MHPVIAEQMAHIVLEDRRREARDQRTHGIPEPHRVRARLGVALVALGRRLAPDVRTEPAVGRAPQASGC